MLYKVMRRRNNYAIIMFSAILPYADKFDKKNSTGPRYQFHPEKNGARSQGGTRLFMASHVQFLRRGRP